MSTMRVGTYTKVGPDLESRWGKIPSPYIISDPTQLRHPWAPPTYRGRHLYKTIPRQIPYLVDHNGVKLPGPGPITHPAGHSLGQEHQAGTKASGVILLGIMAVLGIGFVLIGTAQTQRQQRG